MGMVYTCSLDVGSHDQKCHQEWTNLPIFGIPECNIGSYLALLMSFYKLNMAGLVSTEAYDIMNL